MTNEIWTVGRILKWTEQYFQEKGIETARLDGEVLLSHVLKKDRIYCYSHYDQPLTKEELANYKKMVLERVNGKSVAVIVGKKEFMGIDFIVDENVLIPRPDTETLVESALKLFDRDEYCNILDICLGSGAILISLLYYMKKAQGVGIELSEKAIKIAEKNKENCNLSDRMKIIKSDLFENLEEKEKFDLITSNPPYIPTAEIEKLSTEVLAEPNMALDGGITGLDFYEPIICKGANYLKSDGWMLLEFGEKQEDEILNIANKSGLYKNIETIKDLGGIIRVIALQRI